MSKTMRAAVFADFGGPEVVEVRKVPMPEPGPGQVRIKVEAAAMKPASRPISFTSPIPRSTLFASMWARSITRSASATADMKPKVWKQ